MTVDITPPAKITSITPEERASLGYRSVTADDYDQLFQYRLQCGWGEARLKEYWQHPDRPLCIFYITVDGEQRDIGMGGWILDVPGDPVIASRENKIVELSASTRLDAYQMKANTQRHSSSSLNSRALGSVVPPLDCLRKAP